HIGAFYLYRLRHTGQIEICLFKCSHRIVTMTVVSQVVEIGAGHGFYCPAALRIAFVEDDEFIERVEWKWLKDDLVEHGIPRNRRGNAEAQGQDRHDGESAVLEEYSKCKANVFQQCAHSLSSSAIRTVRFPCLFPEFGFVHLKRPA